jgi:hypothetical protein
MNAFLRRFGSLVAGVLQGFDRLVLKGKLRQLYGGEGMHFFLGSIVFAVRTSSPLWRR